MKKENRISINGRVGTYEEDKFDLQAFIFKIHLCTTNKNEKYNQNQIYFTLGDKLFHTWSFYFIL